jgi:magnesium-transporting ATPase (P-type)
MNDLRDQTLRWEPDSHRPEIQIATWHSLEITETVEHLGTDSQLGLSPEETARTMAVSTVVGAEMFYPFNSRYIFRPVLSREGLMGNHYVLIAVAVCAALQLAYVYTTPLQLVFGSTDLAAGEWMRVVLAGALVFTFAELEKVVMRNFTLVSFSRG